MSGGGDGGVLKKKVPFSHGTELTYDVEHGQIRDSDFIIRQEGGN